MLYTVTAMAPRTPDYMDESATVKQRLAELIAEQDPKLAMRQRQASIALLREAIEITPRHVEYRVHLGDALHQLSLRVYAQGKSAEASSLLEEAVRQEVLALQVRADYSVAKSQLAAHRSRMARWIAIESDRKAEDVARAVRLAKQSIELAPESSDCWRALALAHYRSAKWEAAAAERAVSLTNAAADHLILAMARHQQGKPELAAAHLDQALGLLSHSGSIDSETKALKAEAMALMPGAPPAL